MHHIHLANTLEMQNRWTRTQRQFYRTTRLNDPENDFWLIYTYDEFKDEYLLLTILGPDAHNRDDWGAFWRSVHNQIVEPWVLGKTTYPDEED